MERLEDFLARIPWWMPLKVTGDFTRGINQDQFYKCALYFHKHGLQTEKYVVETEENKEDYKEIFIKRK